MHTAMHPDYDHLAVAVWTIIVLFILAFWFGVGFAVAYYLV